MIKINLYYNNQGDLWHFSLHGHAGYADHGQDVVCAGVSMIVINTINSIESFTDEPIKLQENSEEGYIDCIFPQIKSGKGAPEAILLLKSMTLGLESTKNQYGEYIQINIHQGGE